MISLTHFHELITVVFYVIRHLSTCRPIYRRPTRWPGRDPGAVVKAACLESRRSRVRTPFWPSSFIKTKCFSLVKIHYCGERPRVSVLGLRPPWLEFRIMCLDGSVISFISPSSGGSPGPVWLTCAQRWPKEPIHFFSFHI